MDPDRDSAPRCLEEVFWEACAILVTVSHKKCATWRMRFRHDEDTVGIGQRCGDSLADLLRFMKDR